MKYAFAAIAIIAFLFTLLLTISEQSPIALGIASGGFAIATALMDRK